MAGQTGAPAAVVLAVIAGGVALWYRAEITRLLAVNRLFDADRIVSNFSHMDTLFLTRPMDRGTGPVSPLPPGPAFSLPDDAAQWVRDRSVTAIVILQGGQLVHESYYLDTGLTTAG